jgi:elongation factor Ts
MAITASMVKELREMTGAGMMDCKNALVETDGDLDQAVEYLKEKGLAKAAKKAGRIAAEGLVRIAISEDEKTAAVVEVNSETDFVAKNEEFITFVDDLAKLALTAESNDMDAFKAMAYDGATVGDALTAKIAKIGENMSLRRIDKATGDVLTSYIHGGGRIGVIVAAAGEASDANKAALKNIAMQVAAMSPQYVSRDDISAEELENIHKVTLESALNDPFTLPKPILNALLDKAIDGVWSAEDTAILEEKRAEKGFNFNYLPNFLSDDAKAKLAELAVADKANIVENKVFTGLVEGRMKKQLKEICLLDQTYVRAEDGKQSVAQYLNSVDPGLSLTKVIRFEVGEGLEKKNEDFAAEVAAQTAAAQAK